MTSTSITLSEREALSEAVRQASLNRGLSIRELARLSGVSAAQINRLRAGQGARPRVETLRDLARTLDRNLNLLLALAGHLDPEEVRVMLRRMFGEGSEVIEEWKEMGRDVNDARRLIDAKETSDDRLRRIVLDVFLFWDIEENQWQDAYAVSLGTGRGARELREISQLVPGLSEARLQRVVEFVRDQYELSKRAELNEIREEFPDYGKD
jgi:transcriptional regulator with XRE-family HTH domain